MDHLAIRFRTLMNNSVNSSVVIIFISIMIAQNPKPYSQYPMIFQLNGLYWFQIWSFLGMSLPH